MALLGLCAARKRSEWCWASGAEEGALSQIIMTNLLIAIVSSEYDKAAQTGYAACVSQAATAFASRCTGS
jgi:hypothetical protein